MTDEENLENIVGGNNSEQPKENGKTSGNGKNGNSEASPSPEQKELNKLLKQGGFEDLSELGEYLKEHRRLDKTLDKYSVSQSDLDAVIKSARGGKRRATVKLDIPDNHFRYGYFADCHIGHKMFHDDLFIKMSEHFNKEGLDFVVDAGDHLEGMSHRPGHIYELDQIGFQKQVGKAVELFNLLKMPIYGIDGNHDGWYFKPQNAGVVVGENMELMIPNYNHLGQMEGNLEPAKGLIINLFHANDGTAYADSYKLQKYIESFSGGDKPNIVHSGHYHKSIYLFRRNVHGFECGTLCGQTEWMRGKKIQAHMGYGIVDVFWNKKGGVLDLKHEFVPYYEK